MRHALRRLRLAWIPVAWIPAACSDDVAGPAEPVAASLEIVEAPQTLLVADTFRLTVLAKDSSGTVITPSLRWTTANGTVAGVNSNGLVSGKIEGTTTIRVTAGAQSDSISLTVTEGIRFASLAAGMGHVCGIDASGAVYCWGNNWGAQLGVQTTGHTCPVPDAPDGMIDCGPRPVHAAGTLKLTTVSGGAFHTCGLDANGRAHCWGSNGWEQIGLRWDESSGSASPVAVSGGHAFQALDAGGDFNCGLTHEGEAFCWGSHGSGELGTGDLELFTSPLPVAVVGGHRFTMFSGGYSHGCALSSNGAAYCWGYNGGGALGIGRLSTQETWWSEPTPTAVVGGLTFSQVGAGAGWSCAVSTAGVAYCWGEGPGGQLGTGATTPSATPQAVAGGFAWRSLNAGWGHICGITTAGETACWGNNSGGQLGLAHAEECPGVDGQPAFDCSKRPVLLPAKPRKFKSVIPGGDFTCGLDDLGYAFCWGNNNVGQLGHGVVGGSTHIPSPVVRPE